MLSNDHKQTIQSAYKTFLNKRKLKPRYGQRQMIADIANTLGNITQDSDGQRVVNDDAHICVVEAGTGTGKTVAYLLAALPIAQKANKKLVISTATVALQEQIAQKDLPDIQQNTPLSFSYVLAKGRGRYLCLSKLDRLLSEQSDTGEHFYGLQQALYPDTTSTDTAETLTLYHSMMDAIAAGKWDGDRDRWPTEIEPVLWSSVTTNHRECTGRRCSHVSTCSFFKARDAMDTFDCIVTNHDLVLADLALGGGAILPAPKDTIYIFDEGHHLADKTLSHFAYHSRLLSTSKWLEQSNKTLSDLLAAIGEAGRVNDYAEHLPAEFAGAKQQLDRLYPHCAQLLELEQNSFDSKRYRFEKGLATPEIYEAANHLSQYFQALVKYLNLLSQEIQGAMEDRLCSVDKADLEAWFPLVGNWLIRAEANYDLWHSYLESHSKENNSRESNSEDSKSEKNSLDTRHDQREYLPVARWLTLVDTGTFVDVEVCSSPILAAHTLRKYLWNTCYGAVVTSATVTALGRFDRFMMRMGTNQQQYYNVVPSPFDYSRAVLSVPDFAVEANRVEEHTDMLVEYLPRLWQENQGVLVLYASRRQMEEVFERLSISEKENILLQGQQSKQAMLEQHKKRVDQGELSILFGLASFAEGIDLPGDYCQHVIIVKLPFSVPDDPIESALAEWIECRGGNAFMEVTIPDASIRLVQACGRLLRKETDRGQVSILDKRLITKRYGSSLLNSLPQFSREF